MTHRDYFSEGRVIIEIYSDRFEISNPGGLLFKRSELGKRSLARNPLFVDLVHRLRVVERIGSGINSVQKLMKDKIQFDIDSDWFSVIISRNLSEKFPEKSQKTAQKTTQKTAQKILDLINENSQITRKELAEKIGNITEDGVKYHLTRLVKFGKIKRVGPDKGGHWEIT
ncbi:MAG: ATP-binding protein [bacterium]